MSQPYRVLCVCINWADINGKTSQHPGPIIKRVSGYHMSDCEVETMDVPHDDRKRSSTTHVGLFPDDLDAQHHKYNMLLFMHCGYLQHKTYSRFAQYLKPNGVIVLSVSYYETLRVMRDDLLDTGHYKVIVDDDESKFEPGESEQWPSGIIVLQLLPLETRELRHRVWKQFKETAVGIDSNVKQIILQHALDSSLLDGLTGTHLHEANETLKDFAVIVRNEHVKLGQWYVVTEDHQPVTLMHLLRASDTDLQSLLDQERPKIKMQLTNQTSFAFVKQFIEPIKSIRKRANLPIT